MSETSRLQRPGGEEPSHLPTASPASDPASVGDLVRYFHARRARLFLHFGIIAGVGVLALGTWWTFGPRTARAVLDLQFRGIERHEYPNGKKFAVEDIRAPRVIARALATLGVPEQDRNTQEVYRGIELVPIVPTPVLARWKKADRDGTKREEYLPSQFEIEAEPSGFDANGRVQLLYALLHAYQEQVKVEQEAESHRLTPFSRLTAHEVLTVYDFWDIPIMIRAHADTVSANLLQLISESENFRDPTINLSFREVARDLQTWNVIRLEALAAMVHRRHLVRDREAMLRRLEERLTNANFQLQATRAEIAETTKLLAAIERPRPLLAGQLTDREGAPLVDASALEKIVKSDYIGPVVKRVSELNAQAATAEAARDRVQREISLLKAATSDVEVPPPDLVRQVEETVRDFDRIVGDYDTALDGYLDATVASRVVLREGPYSKLKGPSMSVLAALLVLTAAVASILIVVVSDHVRDNHGESR